MEVLNLAILLLVLSTLCVQYPINELEIVELQRGSDCRDVNLQRDLRNLCPPSLLLRNTQ